MANTVRNDTIYHGPQRKLYYVYTYKKFAASDAILRGLIMFTFIRVPQS